MFDDRPAHLGHPLAPARWLVSNTADGSIVSNVIDMSAYVRMLLGRGRTLVGGHETTILSPAGFARFVEPRVLMDEPGAHRGERYGYGVWTSEEDGRAFVTHSGGMVGYTALLMVDVDTGIGAIALQNGGGDKKPVVRYALDAVRAALRGEPVVAMPHPPAPTAIGSAPSLAGTYVGHREIELVATDDGLRLRDGAIGVELERWPDADDAFLVPHPARDRYLLRVLRDAEGAVTELVHGPDRFAPAGRALEGVRPRPTAGTDGKACTAATIRGRRPFGSSPAPASSGSSPRPTGWRSASPRTTTAASRWESRRHRSASRSSTRSRGSRRS